MMIVIIGTDVNKKQRKKTKEKVMVMSVMEDW